MAGAGAGRAGVALAAAALLAGAVAATRPDTVRAADPPAGARSVPVDPVVDVQRRLRDAYVARRWGEVAATADELLAALARTGQDDTTVAADALVALGDARLEAGDVAGAATALRRSLAIYERAAAPSSVAPVAPLTRLATLARDAGDRTGEAQLLARAVAVLHRNEGLNSSSAEPLQVRLAAAWLATGRHAEAKRELLQMLRAAEARIATDELALLPTLELVGNFLLRAGLGDEARPHFERAVAILQGRFPPDDPRLMKPLAGLAKSHAIAYRTGGDPRGTTDDGSRTYQEDAFGGPTCVTDARTGANVCQDIPTPWARTAADRRLSPDGEAALLRAAAIAERSTAPGAWDRGIVLLEAGDWFLLKRAPDRAHAYYARAWSLLEEATDRPPGATNPLRDVRPLVRRPPAGTFANRAVPDDRIRARYVVTSFTVHTDGRTGELRSVEEDATRAMIDESRAAIRGALYAPRFVDGVPVETRDVTVRDVYRVRR